MLGCGGGRGDVGRGIRGGAGKCVEESYFTESYSNPAPVYVKNQNSYSCFHSCYSKNFANFAITMLSKL